MKKLAVLSVVCLVLALGAVNFAQAGPKSIPALAGATFTGNGDMFLTGATTITHLPTVTLAIASQQDRFFSGTFTVNDGANTFTVAVAGHINAARELAMSGENIVLHTHLFGNGKRLAEGQFRTVGTDAGELPVAVGAFELVKQ